MAGPAETLPALIDHVGETAGHGVALVSGDRQISFGELVDRSSRLAAGLAETGIEKGDVVALWLQSDPDWLTAFIACARLGANCIAVNTRFRQAELADILNRLSPKAVFYRPRFRDIDFTGIFREASAESGLSGVIEIACGASSAPAIQIQSLLDARPLRTDVPVAPEDDLIMFATSGTTGLPKFVQHTHRSIVSHARNVAAGFGMTEAGTTMLQALPYCGVFGFCQAMGALSAASPSILMEGFDPDAAVAAISAHRITHMNMTDDMLAACAAATSGADVFSSLRLVGAASFNRGSDLLRTLARETGMPIVGLYGSSEGQALFARRRTEDAENQRFEAGGKPVSGEADIRIRNPETGDEPPAGESGEIEIRGPSLFARYVGDPASTSGAFTADGFFCTGDLGWVEATGSFRFDTRMGDVLRLGGFLVNPDEISDFIETIDGIRACVVVGAETGGKTSAVAFVRKDEQADTTLEDVHVRCREHLAPFKVPRLIHFVAQFPVTQGPNGEKVQRGALRALAEELLAQ